jgi:ribosomal protein S2
MNILAMGQRKQVKDRLEHAKKNAREFLTAERRVVGCSHNWQPVHKFLHKEYMHCLRCGAVKHQDGTIWFFVGRKAIKLTTETHE